MAVRTKILSAFFCFCLLPAGYAHAEQKIARLSEDNIRAFIEETTAMTSGKNLEKSPEEISAFLNKHLTKDAHFKSSMKYVIPGYPPQENSMSMEKEDFIASVQKGAESLADYESSVEIGTIKISRDGKKATIQTKSTESGIMPMAIEGATQHVPVKGSSSCNQIIVLNDGVIQMYNANCATIINFVNSDEFGN
jgi:hypothetical protein